MSKLSKEEQKKQNKAVIIAILILLPFAIIIGLKLQKKKEKKEPEQPKEREEITLLKESVAHYGDQAYKFPESESDYVIDYESFTKWINNGKTYLSICCTVQDERGENYAISAKYTSDDRVLHYLEIKGNVIYDDGTTDKAE